MVTAVSFFNKNIYNSVIKPVWNYRIFLLFSFFFSFLMSHDLLMSSRLSLKFLVLILISISINFLIDFKALLLISDNLSTKILPLFVRSYFIKILRSFILSIEFTTEFLTFLRLNRNIPEAQATLEEKSFFRKNIKILLLHFNAAFSKAGELEKRETDSEITFHHDLRSLKLSRSDAAGLFLALIILLSIPFSL